MNEKVLELIGKITDCDSIEKATLFVICAGMFSILLLYVFFPLIVLLCYWRQTDLQLVDYTKIKYLLGIISLPAGFWWTWGIVTVGYTVNRTFFVFLNTFPKNSKMEKSNPRESKSHEVTVAKNDFQSDDLVLKLLNKKIIKNIDSDPDRVCFDESITKEVQLIKRLTPEDPIEDIKVELILDIWRQSHERIQ